MSSKIVLITGGYGCIGAETCKWLIRHSDASVVVCSRVVDPQRGQRVFFDVDRSRIEFVAADVRDQQALQQILTHRRVTHVVHLAALQTPDCNARRDLGLQINLAGTQNLIEAIKSTSVAIERLVFASSIAVYGPRAAYPQQRVPTLAEPRPVNVYGAWKLAGECLSRFFCQDTGVPTVSLRPGVLFGPGRDAGLTSTPTTAIKALALGLPYQIPYRSRQDYLYAPDVGAAFGNAVLGPFQGYGVYTLPSQTLDTERIVQTLRDIASELGILDQFKITIGDSEVPFVCDLDYEPFLRAFPDAPLTPLHEALRQSVKVFQDQTLRGWLTAADIQSASTQTCHDHD